MRVRWHAAAVATVSPVVTAAARYMRALKVISAYHHNRRRYSIDAPASERTLNDENASPMPSIAARIVVAMSSITSWRTECGVSARTFQQREIRCNTFGAFRSSLTTNDSPTLSMQPASGIRAWHQRRQCRTLASFPGIPRLAARLQNSIIRTRGRRSHPASGSITSAWAPLDARLSGKIPASGERLDLGEEATIYSSTRSAQDHGSPAPEVDM